MKNTTNEQDMKHALQIIQTWATVAGSNGDLSWAAMAHEMDSIAALARETLEKYQQQLEAKQ